jgi:hypothetical protein
MRAYTLDTLERVALKFGKEEPTGKRSNLRVFDELKTLSVFIFQVLGVEPIINETENCRIYIFEDY